MSRVYASTTSLPVYVIQTFVCRPPVPWSSDRRVTVWVSP